jgi:hypothetical protein
VRKYHIANGKPHKPQVLTRFRVSFCFPITGVLGIKKTIKMRGIPLVAITKRFAFSSFQQL